MIDLDKVWGDMRVLGKNAEDRSSYALAYGDINSYGCSDIIINAFWADPDGRVGAGETYLISGGGAFITAHGLDGKSWVKAFSLPARDRGSFKAFGGVNAQGEVHLGKSNY